MNRQIGSLRGFAGVSRSVSIDDDKRRATDQA